MIGLVPLIALYAVLTALLLWSELGPELGPELGQEQRAGLGGRRRLTLLFKPAASLLFVIIGFRMADPANAFGQFIVAGLIASFVGDVLLLRKGTGPLFVLGMIAFLAAHLLYAAGFVSKGISGAGFLSAGFLSAGLLGAVLFGIASAAITLFVMRRSLTGVLRSGVGLYSLAIGTMLALAAQLGLSRGLWALFIAALMFALSDMAVARDRFIRPERANYYVITPLYFGAQLLFALCAGL